MMTLWMKKEERSSEKEGEEGERAACQKLVVFVRCEEGNDARRGCERSSFLRGCGTSSSYSSTTVGVGRRDMQAWWGGGKTSEDALVPSD